MKKIRNKVKQGFFSKLRNGIMFKQRKFFHNKKYVLPPAELLNLRFFQFKPGTAEFFYDQCKKTDVLISDTPHYQLAKAVVNNNETELVAATKLYGKYLLASWQDATTQNKEATAANIQKRIDEYKSFILAAMNGGARLEIVSIVKIPGAPGAYVLDGNHRSAIAMALKFPIKVEEYVFDLAFTKYCRDDRYYATGNKSRPYQSLYMNGQVILEGRRSDAVERIKMIPEKCLQGMRVLDVASNFGMSTILAKKHGARQCVGLELLDMPLRIASRFAMFEGVYPEVAFKKFDIDFQSLDSGETFDTAFMFSIYSHLQHPEQLLQIARNNVAKYIVFEGHPRHTYETYASFFDSGLFTSVTELGRLKDSVTSQKKTRILWLCEKSQ